MTLKDNPTSRAPGVGVSPKAALLLLQGHSPDKWTHVTYISMSSMCRQDPSAPSAGNPTVVEDLRGSRHGGLCSPEGTGWDTGPQMRAVHVSMSLQGPCLVLLHLACVCLSWSHAGTWASMAGHQGNASIPPTPHALTLPSIPALLSQSDLPLGDS